MDSLTRRLAALTPEQRELLALRAKRELDVVIPPEPQAVAPGSRTAAGTATGPVYRRLGFSLFFFSDEGAQSGTGKYRLLLDCARFADRHGFEAIWTPERHFQEFGGLYPNPSVLSAALAMVTERLEIRAGSLVLPLHNPIRVAEDWALLDNLSGGRVGVSFGSGWHPRDFALAPEYYEERKEIMWQGIETIRRIWAEGVVRGPGVGGEEVEVKVLPRPLQTKLPIWITSSGSLETWVKAGELGAHVLSAMHGDPADDLAPRIRLYREARQRHGHDPEGGRVTVMLHTFLGEDLAAVREQVRRPLTRYLRTFVAQGRELDLAPLGLTQDALSDRDLDELATAVFERYFEQRSLLGTPAKCGRTIQLLKQIGVDELACLIDFGLAEETILAGLEHLRTLQAEHGPAVAPVADI